MNVKELIVRLKADAEQFKAGLSGAKQQMGGFQNAMVKALPGSMMIAKGLAAATVAAGGLATKGILLAAELEQTEVAFKTLLGSGEAATKMMEDLETFAASTPFQFPELANSAKLLAAFNVETKDIVPTLQRLGDVSAGIGAPVNEIAEIYGKAKVQGRLFMEDINQLTGRGIPIIQELAKQFGVTEGEIRELVANGEVNFGHLEQAFKDLTSEGGQFEGMMEAQSQTLGGLWSTAKDNVSMSLASIGDGIIEAFDLKDKLKGFIEGLEPIKEAIIEFAELVSEVGLKEALEQIFSEETKQKIFIIGGAILAALVPALWAAATAIYAAMIPLLPFIAAGAALGAIAYVIYSNWDVVKEFFVNFWDSIKEKWAGIKDWFGNLWDSIKTSTTEKWNGIKDFFGNVWESIRAIGGGKAGELFDAIQEKFMAIWNFIVEIWTQIKEFYTQIWEAIKALFRGDLDAVGEHLRTAYGGMFDFIKDIWGRIKEFFISVWEAMKQGVKEKVEAIRQAIVDTFNRAIDWIKSLPSQAVRWGRDLINGFVDGVKQMASRLINAVKGAIGDAIDAAKSLLGISSPSKVFFEIGGDAGAGFIRGIRAMTEYASQAMQQMVQPPQMNLATATPTGGVPTKSESHITLDMNGLFAGANITIGSEKDAQSLVREIYRMAQSRAASEGVRL